MRRRDASPYLRDAATKVDNRLARITATRDELLRLQAKATGDSFADSNRSALAHQLHLMASVQARELNQSALLFVEAALTAATEVRAMIADFEAAPLTLTPRAHRDLRSYVRKVGRLSAQCERITREALEAGVTDDECTPGKHRKLKQATDLQGRH